MTGIDSTQSAFEVGAADPACPALPFMGDVPDPGSRKGWCRELWHIPDTADYAEAYDTGARWAAAFVEYQRDYASPDLRDITFAIRERESTLPPFGGSSGYSAGFLDALVGLAQWGGSIWSTANHYVEAQVQERARHRALATEGGGAPTTAAQVIKRVARKTL